MRGEDEPPGRSAPEPVEDFRCVPNPQVPLTRRLAVTSLGIDLHKKTIVLCVMDQHRKVLKRRTFACGDTAAIVAFFRDLGPFRAVVEATASYQWLVALIEPLAERVVLANPKKLR